MQPFTTLTAVAAPLEIAKIDTGMILPGRFMRRHRRPGPRLRRGVPARPAFRREWHSPRADFVLNQPAYRDAKILVTDPDFGCGSSREGAAYRGAGLRLARADRRRASARSSPATACRTASSRSRLPEAAIHDLWRQLREKPGAEITIDLPNQKVIAPNGSTTRFRHQPAAQGSPGARHRRHRRHARIPGRHRSLRDQAARSDPLAANGAARLD